MSMQIPFSITSRIIEYLEARQMLTGIDLSPSDFYMRVYAPLLWVNREWRAAAMMRMVKECVFTAEYPAASSSASYSNAPDLFNPDDYPMCELVRTVTLRLNIEGVISGEVSELLTSPQCILNNFTYATNLNVELYTSD
ncbi:hypothetical protein IWW38_004828, partial [Coemansia aciculifera]